MMEQTAYARVAGRHVPAAPAASVVEAFERQVDAEPTRDAIRSRDEAMGDVSFGALDACANAIAAELLSRRGSKPEPVPLMVRSPGLMLAAALGVLKAGKFYAAVNPMHPAPHVQRILDELDAPLLLCDRRGEDAPHGDAVVACVDEIVEARRFDGRPELQVDESRLAYVLYTSGSTGRPRGVAQSRRDMLHNVARHRPLAIGREDCVTLISADGFVASISNPYIALLGGAALAPYSFRDSGVDRMIDWLQATGVTVLYGFPSFLRQLAAAEPARTHGGLRLAYLGGETVLPADLHAARRLFPAAALSVGLNSSETGLTCLHVVAPGSPIPDPVPAGQPVLDVEVAIVDGDGAPVPPGERGEIEISSEYVRPRYWRRGDVREDDVPAPAFRTGDRGRIDADGAVFHLGRLDQMVKVRGFRVETREVEAAISAIPGVAEAAAFGIGEPPDTELTACVVASGGDVDPVTVRSALAHELPPALIPTHIAIVDALPRTPNGKIDRSGLARLASPQDVNANGASANGVDANGVGAVTAGAEARFPAARKPAHWAVERCIAEIWKTELEVDRVRPGENFFSLGGTSLTAVSVISRVHSEFGVPVPLATLFRTPTVGALATAVIELQEKHAADVGPSRGSVAARPVRERDLADICALVNHYIEHTTFNFHTEPQTTDEWLEEWSATRSSHPWLAASVDGVLVGVAYAGPWKGRAAYDWCAEVTVYVANDAQRAGVGRALYERLLPMLDDQGYRTQVAAITLPNPASVALHEACGFRHTGTLDGVGYKQGTWLDVGFWQRGESRQDGTPAPVASVPGE